MYLGILFILYSAYLFIKCSIKIKNNNINLKSREKNISKCIIIPARDESRVIEKLLISIDNQTSKVDDTYVIVESKGDKTVDICKKYNKNVIIREKLDLKRKGYALEEGIEKILKEKKYDMYFIFDADNILDSKFIENMEKTYISGYDIAIGYRNCKNGNDNVISAVSSLTFSMINTIGNKNKIKNKANVIISGTGFYISGDLIEKWGTFPFHTLTEDYELSLYAILNNIPTYYNEDAVYYDEQPIKFYETINQRVRWIKGYITSRKKYIPLIRKKYKKVRSGSMYNEIIGVRPYIFLIIGLVILLFYFKLPLLVLIYLVMVLITFLIIKSEKLDLNFKTKIKAILFNPIYLTTYIICALKALFQKDVKWVKIEHSSN